MTSNVQDKYSWADDILDAKDDAVLMGVEDSEYSWIDSMIPEDIPEPDPGPRLSRLEHPSDTDMFLPMPSAALNRDAIGGLGLKTPGQDVVDTFKAAGMAAVGTAELAMSVASGMLLYFPSKLYGLMALPFGREVANIAEEEMASLGYQPYTKMGKEASELVGKGFELFLTPARNLGEEVSKLNPEAGYLVEFGAELAEFTMTGGIAKGAKAKFKPKLGNALKLLEAKKEMELESIKGRRETAAAIPDEMLRTAQEKILAVEETQTRLRIDEAVKKVTEETLVKEDVLRQQEEIHKAKLRPVQGSGLKKPEGKVEPVAAKPTTTASLEALAKEHGVAYKGEAEGLHYFDVAVSEKGPTTITLKDKDLGKLGERIVETKKNWGIETEIDYFGEGKTVTDIERVTGTAVPELAGTKSPFFQDIDLAKARSKMYEERGSKALEDPYSHMQKLINDGNSWYHGTKEIDIAATRNELSSLATESKGKMGDFFTEAERDMFVKTAEEAAVWLRNLERPKAEQTVTLYRRGRAEGNWWTSDKSYADVFNKGDRPLQKVEVDISNLNMLDTRTPEAKPFSTLTGKELDKALVDAGYDGEFTLGERGEPIYYFPTKVGAKSVVPGGTTLTFGLDPTKIIKSIKGAVSRKPGKVVIDYSKLNKEEAAAAKKAEQYHNAWLELRKAKDFDMDRFLDRSHIHSYRAIHERAGLLRNKLIKEHGTEGHKIVQGFDAESGSSGHSQRMVHEMMKEAYEGVPSSLNDAVAAVNLNNRLRDIYGYKTTSEFKPPKGMDAAQTEAYAHLMEIFHRLTPEEKAAATKASDIMFEHVKRWVDKMVEVGLKSVEEGELLKAHNYRKLRSINVQEMYDSKYDVKVGDKLVRQSDSGVDYLGKNPIRMIETDLRILYTETANRIFRRIDNQRTKLEWKEFDAKHPDNPYVIIRENDKVLSREERPVPKGWVRDFWYDKGEQRSMYFHPDVALQLMSKGSHMSPALTSFFTNVLGINLVRFLAVGSSAAWAITRGLTMDIGHTFFSARRLDPKTGKWKRVYSPVGPVYLGQIGRDMSSTFYDVFTQGKKTGGYMKEGGLMPFLAMREQKFFGRGVKSPTWYDNVIDGLSYVSKSMEMWNRVAVRQTVLRRLAKENGITLEEAYKRPELTREATNAAVERLPYSQGGWLVKEMDKVIGPFISASYNAARTGIRGAKENPVDFAARVGNLGIAAVGTTVAAILYATEAWQDTPNYEHVRSAVIPLFPETLNFLDENGETIYVNLTIPLGPVESAMYNVFRGMAHKMMYELGHTEIEPDYEAIVGAINSALPVDSPIMLNPLMNSLLAYFRNIEVWKNSRVTEQVLDYPHSKEEGQFDPDVSGVAKDIAKMTGLSGPRIDAAIKQLATPNNEFVWAMGNIYDAARKDVDPRIKNQHWAVALTDAPGIRNMLSLTVPRAYRSEPRQELRMEEKRERLFRNGWMEATAEGLYWYGEGKEKTIDDFIDSYDEDHIRVALERKREFIRDIKDLPNRRSWSSFWSMTPEAKARDYFGIWKVTADEDKPALGRELDELLDVEYISKQSQGRFFDTLDDLKAEYYKGQR